ncbi:hypothetical protein EVAR_438_1 [Eumeta japonica]|uniref:Uncharacterized protein n=1 Tax=Eumeta variegata TaxID=151549 RepID=A0A4C1SB86_EUMVA|nr:hypothetical protein EVAR_438_1 [Eumeta japonica]
MKSGARTGMKTGKRWESWLTASQVGTKEEYDVPSQNKEGRGGAIERSYHYPGQGTSFPARRSRRSAERASARKWKYDKQQRFSCGIGIGCAAVTSDCARTGPERIPRGYLCLRPNAPAEETAYSRENELAIHQRIDSRRRPWTLATPVEPPVRCQPFRYQFGRRRKFRRLATPTIAFNSGWKARSAISGAHFVSARPRGARHSDGATAPTGATLTTDLCQGRYRRRADNSRTNPSACDVIIQRPCRTRDSSISMGVDGGHDTKGPVKLMGNFPLSDIRARAARARGVVPWLVLL